MSRIIKFRAWNDIDKKMCDNGVVLHRLSALLSIKNYHAMQFTGLLDVNGVEIYEGDILECEEHFYYEISWHNKHCCWWVSDVGGLDELPPSAKVIGNIHQNPELLK
jgi:hypothetical protein